MNANVKKPRWHIHIIAILVMILSIVGIVYTIVGFFSTGSLKWSIFKESYYSKIDTIATYLATGEISSSEVIKGDGNWLFYSSTVNGDPVADYEGTNSYSQDEMEDIYQKTSSVQAAMEERGIQFVILIPPNKENIYSEYMPDTYVHSKVSRTDRLVDYLYEKGVSILSIKDELISLHDNYQLYYYYDTHWNQLGAYVGVQKTLEQFGIRMQSLDERSISCEELDYHVSAQDDLAQMFALRFMLDSEMEYTVDGTIQPDWDGELTEFHNPDASIQGTVLLVGDSYRIAMIPALMEQFSDVYALKNEDFEATMIDEFQPDYLIVECLERYSYWLESIDAVFVNE